MAVKTFNITARGADIHKMIADLADYRNRLTMKAEIFLRRLANEVGIFTIDKEYGTITGDSSTDHKANYLTVSMVGNVVHGILTLRGEDVLFVEFGAGVFYNTPAGTSHHPLGDTLGYTIGSYGLGLGANPYWHYQDSTGRWHTSKGTKAQMPMLKAGEAMEERSKVIKILREVFA